MRAPLPPRRPLRAGSVDRVLDDHADTLFDFALTVTDSAAAAIEVVTEAVPEAVAGYGPSVSRATLLGHVFAAALRRTSPPRPLAGGLLEAGDGSHEGLRRVCQEATRVLERRSRGILDLTLRQGLRGEELGAALGIPPGQVSAATKSALAEAEHVVGAVLLSRVAQGDCPGLAAVLDLLPPDSHGGLVAGEVVSHQDSCPACDDRRRALVPIASLLAGIPAQPAPPELRRVARPRLPSVATTAAPARRLNPRRTNPRRQRAVLLLAGTALTLLAASITAAVLRKDDARPARITATPALELSTTGLDFGKELTEASFTVTNPGAAELRYDFATDAPWLTLVAPDTTLPPRGTATILARLDRSRAPEGQIRTEIRARNPRGVAPLAVRVEVDRAPVVSKTEMTPNSLLAASCPGSTPGQMRVALVEESGIDIARLHWREAGGAERFSPLIRSDDGTFTGSLGPVPTAGELAWWVLAVDVRGNTTVSAPATLAVSGC